MPPATIANRNTHIPALKWNTNVHKCGHVRLNFSPCVGFSLANTKTFSEQGTQRNKRADSGDINDILVYIQSFKLNSFLRAVKGFAIMSHSFYEMLSVLLQDPSRPCKVKAYNDERKSPKHQCL